MIIYNTYLHQDEDILVIPLPNNVDIFFNLIDSDECPRVEPDNFNGTPWRDEYIYGSTKWYTLLTKEVNQCT